MFRAFCECIISYFSFRTEVNGNYLLQMPSGKVSVYCHMSSQGLGSCSGGGWTLVMKIDGRKVSHAIFFFFLFFQFDFSCELYYSSSRSFKWLAFFSGPYKLRLFYFDEICISLHGDEARLRYISCMVFQIISFLAENSQSILSVKE